MVCVCTDEPVAQFHRDRNLGKIKSLMPGSVKLGHAHRGVSFSWIVVFYCLNRRALKVLVSCAVSNRGEWQLGEGASAGRAEPKCVLLLEH